MCVQVQFCRCCFKSTNNGFLALSGVCPWALLGDECLGNFCNVLHRVGKMTGSKAISIAWKWKYFLFLPLYSIKCDVRAFLRERFLLHLSQLYCCTFSLIKLAWSRHTEFTADGGDRRVLPKAISSHGFSHAQILGLAWSFLGSHAVAFQRAVCLHHVFLSAPTLHVQIKSHVCLCGFCKNSHRRSLSWRNWKTYRERLNLAND